MPEIHAVTVPQTFELALERHQAGRLADAEALYRQILAAQPDHSDALHLLGVIAHQAGRHDLAVEWISRAIVFDPNHSAAHCNLGEAFRAKGRPREAVAAYRRALALKPHYPEAHNNLGNALQDLGQLSEAIAAYRRAIELLPGFPEAHINLGNALRHLGQLDEAIAHYRHALAHKPDYAEAHNNLGNALRERGQPDGAVAACRRALACKPDFPEAWNNLGNALSDLGQLDEAMVSYRGALELKPGFPDALINLGNALRVSGQLDKAVAEYRRALALKPNYPEAHNNLANALKDLGQLDEAIVHYRQAIELNPDLPDTHNNLGHALKDMGRLDDAVAACRRALALKPDFPEAWNNLGVALRELGQPDEAIAAHRRAIALKPDYPEACNNLGAALAGKGEIDDSIAAFRHALRLKPEHAGIHSNLVYTLQFQPAHDGPPISEERERWNRRFGEPFKRFIRPHANHRSVDRRLRVGYVSPDFRDHVVGRNVMPLFRLHDRRDFEILAYSGVVRPDRLTEEFRRSVQQWRGTVGLGDEALADQIRRDGVDILVDLTQHLEGNRLPMFARKPAPVQVSFAGYPDSAGVEAIEYRISDRHLEARLAEEGSRGQEQVRLIDTFWCYDPCGLEVEVNPLPSLESGMVTFGCLNNFCKVSEEVLRRWARVLRKVKDSRLILLSRPGSHRQRALETLEREGVEAGRVEFVEHCARREYLELYHRLDIVLDTFPYNGHTTSLDALWMGVPVVSLAGARPVSRAGLSQLTNLGLPELIAHSDSEYETIAESLATDRQRLAGLRATLRARMQTSALMDAPAFARSVEAAYRSMWERWCAAV